MRNLYRHLWREEMENCIRSFSLDSIYVCISQMLNAVGRTFF